MRILSLFFLALPLLTSCGDDSSVDCSAFTACGGDVTGTWHYAGNCPGMSSFCPELVIESQPSIEGSFTFNGDGTYTSMGTLNGSSRARIPASCLTGVTSCDQLAFDDTTTCTGMPTSSCTCTTTYNNETQNESGTYTTAGTTITLDTDDPTGYCVSGSTMRIDLGEGNIIVLTK